MNQPTPAATLLSAPVAVAPGPRARSEREPSGGFDAQLDAAVEASKPAPDEKPPVPEGTAPTTPPVSAAEVESEPKAEEAEAPEAQDILDPTNDGTALLATVVVSETLLLASSPGTVLPSEAVTSVDVHAAADLTPATATTLPTLEGALPTGPAEQATSVETASDEAISPAPAAASTVPVVEPVEQIVAEALDPETVSTAVAENTAASSSEDGEPLPSSSESIASTTPPTDGATEPVAAVPTDSSDGEQADSAPKESDATTTDAPPAAADATAPAAHDAAAASTGNESSTSGPPVDPAAVRSAQEPGVIASKAEAVDRGAASGRAPEVDPGRFVSRVSRAIDFANERGGGPIEMRLSPPELGSMQVRIELKEGVMTASLEVDNPTARTALLDNLPALRDRLEQQQIRIDKFDVEVRDDQQRGGDWRQQQDQQPNGERRHDGAPPRPPRAPATPATTKPGVTPRQTSPFGPSGGINLVA